MSENTKEKTIWAKEEIGYLYKRKSSNGVNYLSGSIMLTDELGVEKRFKINVFPNKFKTADNHPDLKIYSDKDVAPKNTINKQPQTKNEELI